MRKKQRVCGKRCHNAKCQACKCWCGGMFHGTAGANARESFAKAFEVEKLPTTLAAFDALTRQRSLFEAFDAGTVWREAQKRHAEAIE
jgi:hypothetical protein